MVGAPGPVNSGAAVVSAEQRRCEVQHVAIDEAGAVERGRNGRAALDHRLHDASPAELVEHDVELTLHLDARLHLGPCGACPSTTRIGSRPWTWRTVSDGSSARTVPAPTMTASLSARSRCASAPRRVARDPLAGAVGSGGAAVEGARQLEHDVRPAGEAVLQVGRELRARPRLHRRRWSTSIPAARSRAMPSPAHVRVGVFDADDDTRDAGRDDRVGAQGGVRP